jgi:hypothetical protein
MFPTDLRLWDAMKKQGDASKYAEIVAGMGNYPWNRIIKTTTLHENSIFFGGTPVHNDVQFHWHSICASKSIGYGTQVVCHHRLFEERSQITNVSDRRRLHVFSALEDTHAVLEKLPSFKQVFDAWKLSSTKVVDWAENVIEPSLRGEFAARREKCFETILVSPDAQRTAG